jgi:hypothetical protein
LQQPLPDQRHHHRRQQHRVEIHAAPEAAADDLAVEHQRRHQRQQHHQHHLEQAELDGVVDGAPEHVLAAGLDVEVVTAFEQDAEVLHARVGALQRHQLHPAGAGVDEVDEDRQEGEQAEHEQVRRHEQPADPGNAEQALPQPEQRLEQVEEQPEETREERQGVVLLLGLLDRIRHVGGDLGHGLVGAHLAHDGLGDAGHGRQHDGAVVLVALELERGRGQVGHTGC